MRKSIAVIIPVYNAERFIEEAIKSVKDQTYTLTEIIVVNDGSTDRTSEILNTIDNIKVIEKKNSGIGDSLNTGIKNTDAEVITFLDADDLWIREKLSIQMEAFEKMNCSGIVFGQIEQFFHDEMEDDLKSKLEQPKKFLPGVHRSTMLIDKASLEKVGFFSTDYVSEEFLEWFIRAKESKINVKNLPELVAKRRIHGDNITLGLERKEANKFPSILKQALDRRRSKQ